MKIAIGRILRAATNGDVPSAVDALALECADELARLCAVAANIRDANRPDIVTYSPKVFIPLTQLCRDICRYFTFAEAPQPGKPAYLSLDDVLNVARAGAKAGCRETLFTLGDRPELRLRAARDALAGLGFDSTLAYLRHVAEFVLKETGLLPHLNPGNMTRDEVEMLRPVAA